MTACYWYGTPEDHRETLEELFAMEAIQVWPNASEPGEDLERYPSPESVLSEFASTDPRVRKPHSSVNLKLFLEGTGPGVIARIGGSREHADGLGLATFQLGRVTEAGVSESWSGCHTLASALRISEPGHPAMDAELWDLDLVARRMNRLYRKIRSRGVAKIGRGSPVHPDAVRMWATGTPLTPFSPQEHKDAFRPLDKPRRA